MCVIRSTQSIIYIPLQVNRFQKSILLIVEYKYSKSCSKDSILQNPILRTRSCGTGFITQSSWVFHFHQMNMIGWKCFVPQLYQFRRGISGGPALQYFNMILKGGRTCIHERYICRCVRHEYRIYMCMIRLSQMCSAVCNTMQQTHTQN